MKIPEEYMDQMKKDTERGIKAGWNAAHYQWRRVALEMLCITCLSVIDFTVNDFRDRIIKSGITTHDNRAMGGLMMTAKNLGWIEPTGNTIKSKVGHKSLLQIWRSKIYQGDFAQQSLF